MPQTNAHDLIAILSCGGGSGCPIRAWEAVLELSCHCPFAIHTSTRQVMSVPCLPPASGSVLRGARAHSRWPSAAQDSLLECHRAIVRSSNKPGLTSSASLTHLHAPLGGLEQPTSAYGGWSHSCSPSIPHAPGHLLESLRSCFIRSVGLAGSWQGSGVFSNGTESEYSTASIKRGAYGPPLFSLDPRAPRRRVPRGFSLSRLLRPTAPLSQQCLLRCSPGTIAKAGRLHVLAFAEGDGVEALAAEEYQPLTESSQSAEISEAMPPSSRRVSGVESC